ncbi:MAG TPA: GGDEF domain-containing protein [Candidatus Limnocylindrales bacterium]|nr:GGDEF domain-containing protein [Candidatus Limnocylindrales bacterium]
MTSDALLQDAIRAAARSHDPEAALDDLLRLAGDTAGGRAAALLWDADRGALAVAGSRGLVPGEAERLEAAATTPGDPIRRAAHDRIAAHGEASDAAGAGRSLSAWPIEVVAGGVEEPLGVLVVLHPGPVVTARGSLEDVAAIADLIGLTVDRVRLASDGAERSDWVERVNHSDPLTGLANARTLARVIELEIARAARQGSELCLALFDVDGLTKINDAAGHGAGDDILREVAAVAAESIRFVDTIARWGGDEFLLVAPGAKGTTVAQRIVESVAARPAIGGTKYTVSAGISRFPADGTTGEELIDAATRALRAAQAAGPGTFAEAART